MPRTEVLILAAGLGTRMKSDLIKVLHEAAGCPIIDYVLDLAREISASDPIVVVGHQRDKVQERGGDRAAYAVQDEQLGTGHAVLQAESLLRERSLEGTSILVLSGDVPLTRPETLHALLEAHEREGALATVLTMKLDDPAMYGRIVRKPDGGISKIVEAKDADAKTLTIDEVNTGIYVFDGEFLFDALHRTSTDNAQGEYYLPDVIAMAAEQPGGAAAMLVDDPIEALGVNSREDLWRVERELRRRKIAELMAAGVTFRDPDSVIIDHPVRIGPDTIIYNGVCLEGATTIGRQCTIGPGSHLVSCVLGDNVTIRTGTVASEATIEHDSTIGPYAHLRPGTFVAESVKIGNFVETKKAIFAKGAKASHLSYIGDAEVGEEANIGAGTITCNYDGKDKHKTIIEDGAFIGSNSELVAPVRIGRNSYVGAGSTITKNVPADSLAISRAGQRNIEGWAKRKREEEDQ